MVRFSRLGRDARGMVTAETAVVLPVLLLVLGVAVGMLLAVAAQLSCVDAARAAARVAARGEEVAAVQAAARRAAPTGAIVQVRPDGDDVEVRVLVRVRPFGLGLRLLPSLEVSGRALAAVEALP